jgi:DNA-binding transcriptional LysR family regulator
MAVAETDNYSKAAELLGVTQSAISQNIKKIEKKLDFAVVTKQGKSVSLTGEGQKLAEFARQYFTQFQTTVDSISKNQQKMSGALRVGTLMGLGKTWLANHMISYSKEYPEINTELLMDFTYNLIGRFQAKQLDVLILPESFVPSNVDRKILGDEHFTLIFPKNSRFQIDQSTGLKEIIEYPVIFFQEKDPLFFDWCRQMYGVTPKQVKSRMVINSFSHMFEAVASGLGMAVIPIHVVNKYIPHHQDRVAMLPEHLKAMKDQLCFIHHQGADEYIKVQTLLDRLRASLNRSKSVT